MGKKKNREPRPVKPDIVTPESLPTHFDVKFFKTERCRDWILSQLHPHGAYCPGCTTQIKREITLKNFWGGRRCTCRKCNLRFTALSGTQFQGTHLDFREIFLMFFLIGLNIEGVNISKIAKLVGISENTTRRWIKKDALLKMLKKSEE